MLSGRGGRGGFQQRMERTKNTTTWQELQLYVSNPELLGVEDMGESGFYEGSDGKSTNDHTSPSSSSESRARVHPERKTFLSRLPRPRTPIPTDLCEEFVEVDGHHIPVVAGCKGFKALGTQFTLHGRTSAELKARMGAAWGKFRALWPILGKRDGNLLKRLRLFDSCITLTALWCNESWLLTKVEKPLLRSTQNNMLRRIAGPRRKPEEQWVDWVKRSTREARHAAKKAGIRFWVESHLRSKWCWAGHVLRMSGDRLAHRSAIWRDSAWQMTEKDMPAKIRVRRPHRTRWSRWEDDLRRFADQHVSGSWQEAAQDREAWQKHVSDFIRYAA